MSDRIEVIRRRVTDAYAAIVVDHAGEALHPADLLAITESVLINVLCICVPEPNVDAVLERLVFQVKLKLPPTRLARMPAAGRA